MASRHAQFGTIFSIAYNVLMRVPPVNHRPFPIRIVLWSLGGLVVWNIGRAIAIWLQLISLADLHQSADPRMRLALSLVWAILFMTALASLRRGYSASRLLVSLLIGLFGVYELGMMIAYATVSPAALVVIVYGAFFMFSLWALWRPAIRNMHTPHTKEGNGPNTL